MTVDYPFSLAQLAHILSVLENERRNPNTKRNAIKAIERNAAQIGLTAEDVFDAADGLLSGRLSAAEWRAALRDEGCGPASFVTEAPAEPAPDDAADEPAQAYIMPNAGPLAVAQSGTGDDAATDVAEAAEDAPVAATAAVAANPDTTGTRVGLKEQLLAACQAAEHWLQAELDRPGETQPDEILRVLRAAIERAEGQRKARETHQPRQSRRTDRRRTRKQQGGHADRDAAPAGGGHHRADHGRHRLAGAHLRGSLRRRAEKEARPDRHLGEARRRRARLPSRPADGAMPAPTRGNGPRAGFEGADPPAKYG